MNRTQAWQALNILAPSPGVTPANGPEEDRSDLTLSFPCDGNELQSQLEQWTNTSFNFDSDMTSPIDYNKSLDMTLSPGATLGKHGLDSSYSFGLGNDVDIESLLAPSTFGGNSTSPSSFESTGFTDHQPSLVDPELHLPGSQIDRIAPGLLVHAPTTDVIVTPNGFNSVPVTSVAPISVIQSTSASAPKAQSQQQSPPAKSTTKKASAPKKRKTSSTAAAAAGASATTPVASSTAASTPAADSAIEPKPIVAGVNGVVDADDAANALAIEEDKRRRNTAASARFRVKKKQREQALEQSAKELRERVAQLENEVSQLKTENVWLKGLIVDKPTDGPVDSSNKKRSADEITV